MPDHRDDDLTPLTAEDVRLLLGEELAPAGDERLLLGEELAPARDEQLLLGDELAPGAVRRERELGVSADEAWELLRDADGLSRWLADEVDVVVAPGERGQLRDDDGAVRDVVIDEVEDGRRVALRWWTAEGEESLVDLVLDDVDGASRLTVTEIPLQVIAVPDAVPTTWTIDGGSGAAPIGGAGPHMLALACR